MALLYIMSVIMNSMMVECLVNGFMVFTMQYNEMNNVYYEFV